MSWQYNEHGIFVSVSDSPTHRSLPAGAYVPGQNQQLGLFFTPLELMHDKILMPEDSVVEAIFGGIETFWNAAGRYRKYGVLHKRNYLLHGQPGTGKTMLAMAVAELVVSAGGYALCPHAGQIHLVSRALAAIRSSSKAPIVNILEDIQALAQEDKQQGYDASIPALLSLLDGEAQVDNIVHVATTNYLDQLPNTVTNRPSRFDEVIEVGTPCSAVRRAIIEQIIPSDERLPAVVDALVAGTDGLTFAHIKEAVIAVQIMGKPLAEVVARLQAMNNAANETKE